MFSPQKMLDAVVSIGIKPDGKNMSWIGTGFIVSKIWNTEPKAIKYYLITNRHVVKKPNVIFIRFNSISEKLTEDIKIILRDDNGTKLYSEHWNENSDVIAREIDSAPFSNEKIIWQAFNLDLQSLTLKQMEKEGLEEGSLVYALGFPIGLVDIIKTPIFRLGCISKIRNTYISDSLFPTFLIDAQSFPGNSGSPVINKHDFILTKGEPHIIQSYLIGILSGHYPYEEKLYSAQTGKVKMILEENTGITDVHPVDRIKEVVELEYKRLHP